jgi:hypothetical protein
MNKGVNLRRELAPSDVKAWERRSLGSGSDDVVHEDRNRSSSTNGQRLGPNYRSPQVRMHQPCYRLGLDDDFRQAGATEDQNTTRNGG